MDPFCQIEFLIFTKREGVHEVKNNISIVLLTAICLSVAAGAQAAQAPSPGSAPTTMVKAISFPPDKTVKVDFIAMRHIN